jgi:uncharacterized protein (DUF1778 family)
MARNRAITLRVSLAEMRALEQAAHREALPLSSWVRHVVVLTARQAGVSSDEA